MLTRLRRFAIAAMLGAMAASPARSGHEVTLMRPLVADPRENQFRMKFVSFTEDWRFGTDITDPLSRGGVQQDRTNVSWDVGVGSTLRFNPWSRFFGKKRLPWAVYQLSIPAGIFANFDRVGAELVNADYQFGAAVDLLWTRGHYDSTKGIKNFNAAIHTSRLMAFHRSTHLGDEHLALGRFGTNQTGHPDEADLFAHPPVKRVNLTFESVRLVHSIERTPRPKGKSTVRLYGAIEKKVNPLGRLQPWRFRSAIYQAGAEFRSAGNVRNPKPGRVLNWINRALPRDSITGEWFAAIDFKLAKSFNFAGCDNPSGESEVWTPNLWTTCLNGHEHDEYAGSWHAMLGIALYWVSHRFADRKPEGQLIGPATYLTLDWYRGYSPNGQFLDQRLRYRPLGYLVPGIVVHF